MSTQRDDGGPAFPCEWNYINSSREAANGMSLRDYFAAKAMQSMLMIEVHTVSDVRPGETTGQWIARKAYAMADAMLKARQQ